MGGENLAYEFRVNDEDPITAGSDELAVLSAMLTHVRERGGADFSVAGLVVRSETEHEHWRWAGRPLGPGDTLTIRVVEDATGVEPVARETIDPTAPPRPDPSAES